MTVSTVSKDYMAWIGNMTVINLKIYGIGIGNPSKPGNILFISMLKISENYDNILYQQSDITLEYNPNRITTEISLNPPVPFQPFSSLIFSFEIFGYDYHVFAIPLEDETVHISDMDGNEYKADFPVLYLRVWT